MKKYSILAGVVLVLTLSSGRETACENRAVAGVFNADSRLQHQQGNPRAGAAWGLLGALKGAAANQPQPQ
jgi:hypothetical protein